jgi:hypothetical protein
MCKLDCARLPRVQFGQKFQATPTMSTRLSSLWSFSTYPLGGKSQRPKKKSRKSIQWAKHCVRTRTSGSPQGHVLGARAWLERDAIRVVCCSSANQSRSAYSQA